LSGKDLATVVSFIVPLPLLLLAAVMRILWVFRLITSWRALLQTLSREHGPETESLELQHPAQPAASAWAS